MDKEESKKNPNYYKNLLDSNDFNEFEEIFQCHFSAVMKEVVGEEKERLAKCLNLEFQNRAE